MLEERLPIRPNCRRRFEGKGKKNSMEYVLANRNPFSASTNYATARQFAGILQDLTPNLPPNQCPTPTFG